MVKPGYKQTEFGIIPETWTWVTFRECFNVLPNNTLSRSELNYDAGSVWNIHYGDILVKFPAVLQPAQKLPYINNEHAAKIIKGFLQDGDLIIADTAEDTTVGKAVEISGVGDRKIVSGLHTIPCRPKDPDKFAAGWLGYFANSNVYHDQLLPLITGTKVSAVSRAAIADTVLLLPPEREQRRIVEALADADGLIISAEKLIAKKKAIKRGTMQELLTGRKRLSGFHEEWTTKKVGEIATMYAGGTPDTNNPNYYNGPHPWVSISDISSVKKYISNTQKSLTDLGLQNSSAKIFPVGTLLFAMYASIGKCCITKCEACSSQAILGLYNLKGCEVEFLYYVFLHREKDFLEMGQTGTQANLSKQIVEDIILRLPSLEEQRAIASVLASIDEDIAVLEQEASKYRQIKQCMMQQLLTGKIRLVQEEDGCGQL